MKPQQPPVEKEPEKVLIPAGITLEDKLARLIRPLLDSRRGFYCA